MALFTSLAFCGLIAIPLIFIIQLIILPLKRLNSYKREGVMTYFFPIIGFWKYLLDSMKSNVTEFAEKAAKNKVLVTNFGDKVLIMFQSAQYNREFLANQNLYVKGKPTLYMKKMMGDGLVYAEGENWKRHRKIISACFHFDFLKANTGLIQKTAQEIFKQVIPQEYKDFKVVSKVEQITGEIVGKIFLGENLNSYTFEGKPLTLGLAEILCELQKAGETPLVVLLGEKALDIPFIPRYAQVMKKVKGFRKVCLDLISARKALPVQKEDLLGLLLATQKSEDVEKRLTDEDIIDEFITFFLAGMDTTAHLVGMMLYCLIQNPEYLLQIKQEVSTLYNSETDISVDTLQKMKMLHAVMRETLRLYTPAPLMAPREALKDHKILDVEVKKGDFVTAHFMIPGFDEASFEKPQEFNPMRWVNPDKKIDPYAAIPFSGGARNCIGQHLAIIEAKIIVSEFLKMFDYKLKDGYQIRFGLKPIFGPLDDLLVDLNPNHTL